MIRRILGFVAIALLPAAAPAQTAEQLFRDANILYQQGKLDEARDRYEEIVALGQISGEVYYNLGNVYYRTGEVARAILFYERALRLMPQDEDLRHNLQLANLLITDRIEPLPRLFLWQWWDGLKNLVSLTGATWYAYLCYLFLCAAAAFVALARGYRMRKAAALAGVGIAVMFVLTLILFFAKASDAGRTDEGIVLSPVVTVKNSPDAGSSDAFVLHSGVKVRFTDAVGNWIKILLADGKVGWMERDALEVI